jgi:hypothetical protein
MLSRNNTDNAEFYQMIWRFTIAPWLITAGYMYSLVVLFDYIGKSM